MPIRIHLRTLLAILVGGLCLQAWAYFGGQYTIHPGYVQRKLFVSESLGRRGYFRARFDVPQEYGRFVADVSVKIDRSMFWYEDAQGRIRNVEFEDSLANPLLFARESHAYVN